MQELLNVLNGEIPGLKDMKGAPLGPRYLDDVPDDQRVTPYGIDLEEFLAKGGKII